MPSKYYVTTLINALIKGHKNVSMYIKEWNYKLPLELDQELTFEFPTSFPVSSAVCRLWLVVRQICLSCCLPAVPDMCGKPAWGVVSLPNNSPCCVFIEQHRKLSMERNEEYLFTEASSTVLQSMKILCWPQLTQNNTRKRNRSYQAISTCCLQHLWNICFT